MELNFDKEIDALLRQSAQESESVFAAANPQSPHLDADEISAFAANVLPEKTRGAYTAHLADCDRCRGILSNLIALDSEPESEIVQVEEKEIVAPPVPWYRKFFAFPNLAYSLGALVLVFSGIAAFTVLQNVSTSRNAEVSQLSDKQPNGKGMSSDGDEMPAESYSSNSAMSSNSASMNTSTSRPTSAANSMMPAAPSAMANANAAVMRDGDDENLKPAAKPVEPRKEPVDLAETEDSVAGASLPKEKNQLDEADRQKQAAPTPATQNQTNLPLDSRRVQSAPSAALRAENKDKKLEESKSDSPAKIAEPTTTVGGKTFKRANNVWVDSAYRGQATTNITRGTKEYKKLDSGLRVIAENLGGTVVIVWKERAYRIQ